MKHIKNYKKNSGFTLVETLVALAIVMVGLAAAFSVAQIGVTSSTFAKDRITAFFLAQEALEAIKNRRDHNLLSNSAGVPTNWLEGLTTESGGSGPCAGENPCDFNLAAKLQDPTSPDSFVSCEEVAGCVLRNVPNPISPGQFYYGYGGTEDSKFKRQILINEFNDVEASVWVSVTWDGGLHKFETQSYIFSWF